MKLVSILYLIVGIIILPIGLKVDDWVKPITIGVIFIILSLIHYLGHKLHSRKMALSKKRWEGGHL